MREMFTMVGLPVLILILAACRPGPFPKRRIHSIVYPPLPSKRERGHQFRKAGR